MKPYSNYKDCKVAWLESLPSHWQLKRIKTIFKIKKNIAGELGWDVLSVTQKGIKIKNVECNKGQLSQDYSKYQRVTKGDYIMNHMDLLTGWVDCSAHNGVTSPDYRVFYLVDIQKANKYFFLYLFQICYKKKIFYYLGQGVSNVGRWRMPSDAFLTFPLPVPSLPEQQAIVDYLNRETAEMDALITEQKELVSLLKQKRSAIISEAVCHGLDPTVPMKDSEVEWLGMVPAHWEIRQIKSLSLVKRGASPRPIDKACYYDENGMYQWVRISDVSMSNGFLEQAGDRLSKMGESCSVRLEPGSLFVSICASVGKPCITNIKCCIHDGFVYFPNISKKHNKYLFYIFLLGKCYQGLGKLGTQLNLNTDIIGSIKIPIPPLSEQQSIVNYLDHETSEIDHLIADCETSIQLLKQRRTALISEAVTGKIDVRTA